MLALILFHGASSFVGGYKEIPVTSKEVEIVKPFLDKHVEKLFNDAIRINIVKAEKQIVSGFNLRLTIDSYPGLKFVIVLWVNASQQIKITSITAPPDDGKTRRLIGSWMFVDPSTITAEDLDAARKLIKFVHKVTVTPKKVIAARVQIVSGTNRHIIFEDEDGKIHSTVIHRPATGPAQLLYYLPVV